MSRFAKTLAAKDRTVRADTTNLAGGAAVGKDPRAALASLVLNGFAKGSFYRDADDEIQAIYDGVAALGNAKFAAQLAIWARREHGNRSTSHVLAHAVGQTGPAEWKARFYDKVIGRPDDMSEITALFLGNQDESKRRLPAAVKRGFRAAFGRMDKYRLSKWQGSSPGMTLRRVAHLVHPTGCKGSPGAAEGSVIYALRAGTLRNEDTHEARRSKTGQDKTKSAEQKKAENAESWRALLEADRLGFLAAMRNIVRVAAEAPELLPAIKAIMTDPKKAKGTFPHQVYSAGFAVAKQYAGESWSREVAAIFSAAIDAALVTMPTLSGRTLVVVDDSGSMTSTWAGTGPSGELPIELATLLAAAFLRSNDSDLMFCSSNARYAGMVVTEGTPVLAVANQIRGDAGRGGATHLHKAIEAARPGYDRMVFFTDGQTYGHGDEMMHGPLRNYAARSGGARPRVYEWNVVGNDKTSFASGTYVRHFSGLAPASFETLGLHEQDPMALVKVIEAVEI